MKKKINWFVLRRTWWSNIKRFLKSKWLILIFIALYFKLVVRVLFWFPDSVVKGYTFAGSKILDGFKGNVVSGVVTSLLFFLMALYFNKSMEENVEAIKDIEINRQNLLDEEREIQQFEYILRNRTFYNIRMTDTNLIYQIQCLRNPDGSIKTHRSLESNYYIVKLIGPAYSTANTEEYENAELKFNEYYFCRYVQYAGDKKPYWALSESPIGATRHRFIPSGSSSIGGVVSSANQVMGANTIDPAKYTKVSEFLLLTDGTIPPEAFDVSGDLYRIFNDANNNLFLQINGSPLKKIFMSNSQENQNEYHLVIDDFAGYGDSQKRANIKVAVEEQAKTDGLNIPSVEWYLRQE